jgi:hypothetical protein
VDVPELVRVTVQGRAGWFTATLPKSTLAGLRVAPVWVSSPWRPMLAEPPLLVRVRVAVSVPGPPGLKLSSGWQLSPGATAPVHVPGPAKAKSLASGPVKASPVMSRGAVPGLETVIGSVAVVPGLTGPKSRGLGLIEISAWAPDPVRSRRSGDVAVLSTNWSRPSSVPPTDGVKSTSMTQVPPPLMSLPTQVSSGAL